MVWWPFAPQLERADTQEVTGLNNGAPPLHSAAEEGGFETHNCGRLLALATIDNRILERLVA